MKATAVRFEGRRDYPIPVAEAWRLLADTDHMNRALGLPPVDFSPAADAGGSFVRSARARLRGGLRLRWKEYPFEWVHERRLGVRREFESGPLAQVEIAIRVDPLTDGSPPVPRESGHRPRAGAATRVTVSTTYVPSGPAGSFLARLLGRRGVKNILGYCDRYLSRREAGTADPLPPPADPPRIDRPRLESALERLARAPVRADLLPRLRERIVEGTDAQVLRVRPYEVADVWGADRFEVLHLFLHATRAGLFELRWELMCPACRVPKGEASSLSELPGHFHCDVCQIDYDTDFDRRVELRFSVHPAVRPARDDVYCIGSPMRTPHVVAQQILAPGESREVELLAPEPLRLHVLGDDRALALVPRTEAGRAGGGALGRPAPGAGGGHPPGPAAETEDTAPGGEPRESADSRLRFAYVGERWVRAEDGSIEPAPGLVEFTPGRDILVLRNEGAEPVVALLEREERDPRATTAAEVTALQEFRDLFSSEVLAPGQEVGVSSIALLFTDLKGSTSLYEGVGDAPAYGRVNRHFEFLRERIAARRGTVVKTIGDSVMGAFSRLEDALAAALDIQAAIVAWCAARGIHPPLVIKAGVHHGPVIAVNANERLDYFGRTVNVAARLGRESMGGDVVLLAEVFAERRAREAAQGTVARVEGFRAGLKGLEGERELVRLWPEPASATDGSSREDLHGPSLGATGRSGAE